jgi:glycosyltransferase involved in cell wall biosynthesis
MGRFRPSDLRRAGSLLDAFPSPRRLLVQWVPHGYGYRSMNVPFCLWVHSRSRRGDLVDLMVHEPFLAFEGGPAQRAAAAVHRMMTVILLRAARRVWISTQAWRRMLEAFAPARDLRFDWLPVPSPIEPVEDPDGVRVVREAFGMPGVRVIGHFGLYSRLTAEPLAQVIPRLLDRHHTFVVLLMGNGSDRLRDGILRSRADLAARVRATGALTSDDVSRHLQACDLMVQPYPEGITTRRTSAMASLAHGLAVCTTKGEKSEPLWREHPAVSLVAAGDPDAMAAEAERLLLDDCARRRLGTCARAFYEDRFALRHTVDALLAG